MRRELFLCRRFSSGLHHAMTCVCPCQERCATEETEMEGPALIGRTPPLRERLHPQVLADNPYDGAAWTRLLEYYSAKMSWSRQLWRLSAPLEMEELPGELAAQEPRHRLRRGDRRKQGRGDDERQRDPVVAPRVASHVAAHLGDGVEPRCRTNMNR